jgi:hypothetical protein
VVSELINACNADKYGSLQHGKNKEAGQVGWPAAVS